MRYILKFNVSVLLFFFITVSATAKVKKKNILILNSYHSEFSWVKSLMKGIHNIIDSSEFRFNVYTEYLDVKRLFGVYREKYGEEHARLYREKYRKTKFDIIITVDDYAAKFMMKYNKSVFKASPFVFCGVSDSMSELFKNRLNFTGVLEVMNCKKNVHLIEKLFPGTERIAFITDHTVTGKSNRRQIENLYRIYRDRFKFIYLNDRENYISVDELFKKISELPDKTVVYFSDFFIDNSGYVQSIELIEKISNFTRIPIFGHNSFYLGHGIIGGRLNSGVLQGEKAAEIALKILNGTKPSDIKIQRKNLRRYMFDYKQLKMFNIPMRLLPPGSIVVNQPYEILWKYKELAGLVLFVMAFLVINLIFLRIKVFKRSNELIASEKKFRLLAENSPGIVFIARNDEGFTTAYINEKVKDITGYSKEEFENADILFKDLVKEEDSEEVVETVRKSLKEKKPYSVKYRVRTKSGEEKWIEEIGTGIFQNTSGKWFRSFTDRIFYSSSLVGFEGIRYDITEKKREEDSRKDYIRELESKICRIEKTGPPNRQ